MAFRLLADAAMVLHFAFLAYVVLGGFWAWRRPAAIWPHAAVAAYALGITAIGWDCPLTHVENWARTRAGEASLPHSGFIDHYLTGVVYPGEHLAAARAAAAVAVAASYTGALVLYVQRGARPGTASGPDTGRVKDA
ncbi:DUF2784 domain-containing protein [Nocardiopsis coralliicola]